MSGLQELLNKMIEREKMFPEIIKNAPIIEYEAHLESTTLKTYQTKNQIFFVVPFLELVDFIFTPEQMTAFISHSNPNWGKSLKKEIKQQKEEHPKRTLEFVIFMWFEKHPKIAKKLWKDEVIIHIKKAIGYPDVQDAPAPFNIFESLPEFEDYNSFSSFLWRHISNPGLLLLYHGGPGYIRTITQQKQRKMLSYCDQLLILFREELGIHSLKEVESMESALCYLLYRTEWMYQYNIGAKIKSRKSKKEEFASYFESHPGNTVYEYLCDTGGFDGELWPSYEEFLRDEWLEDDLLKSLRTMSEADKRLYWKFRERALQKEG